MTGHGPYGCPVCPYGHMTLGVILCTLEQGGCEETATFSLPSAAHGHVVLGRPTHEHTTQCMHYAFLLKMARAGEGPFKVSFK